MLKSRRAGQPAQLQHELITQVFGMAQPQWYVKRGDQTLGPYSASKFRQLVLQKKVVGLDLVKSSDGVGWSAASSIPGLLEQPSRSSNPIRPIQPGKNEPLSTSDSQELDKATGFMDVCRVLWRLTRKKKIILLATMILLAVWIRLAGRNISNVRSLPDGNNQELVTSSKSRADIAKENLIQIC